MSEQVLALLELIKNSKMREIDKMTGENPELLYASYEGDFIPEIALRENKGGIVIVFLTKLQDSYMQYFQQKDNIYLEKRKLILNRVVNAIFQNPDDEISEDEYMILLSIVMNRRELHFDIGAIGKYYDRNQKWVSIESFDAFYKGNVCAKALLWVSENKKQKAEI